MKEEAAVKWTMSYPEKFISIADTLPFVSHDRENHKLRADSTELLTGFQYEKVDDGCYLFVVDMKALKDTKIILMGDRDIEYYCLSYQLIKGSVNKTPNSSDPLQSKTMSLPRICSFYNNEFDYDTAFDKDSEVKAFIFCFTRDWLSRGVDLSAVDKEASFMKVISKEIAGMAYFSDSFYKDTYDELNKFLNTAKRSPVYNLIVRKLSFTLIADFFTIVADPDSVLNMPGASEDFDGIEEVKKYIDLHFRKGFPGLQKLAEVGNMTVATLRRQFLRQMGRSAFDYFREVQMRFAFDQLQGGMQVKQVALMLGFASQANFSRTFKTVYRVPPTDIKALNSDVLS
ncbi:helix-turn-helix domain-containing protein [Desertivirga xinjiangensis]|uniref:helix-turn-helix domain-containing protein n=1 Tax=Desertivirga xinjiangensis TaxID=539206 RepID=UPI0021089CD9|nr:AraC family transcriptional regulator [Pedobacter xinjiangensis]